VDYTVSWSPEALADVDDIASYIARNSAFYAQGVVTKIIESARNLKNFPLGGRIVPELDNEHIRERFVYS
jgi:plasmid stabilization system protein ParE